MYDGRNLFRSIITAGTLKLEKLIILYDSNNISIEGNTNITFTENVSDRVKAFGFETLTVEDGDNLDEVLAALEKAKLLKVNLSSLKSRLQSVKIVQMKVQKVLMVHH